MKSHERHVAWAFISVFISYIRMLNYVVVMSNEHLTQANYEPKLHL